MLHNPNRCRLLMFGLILSGIAAAGLSACFAEPDMLPPLFVIGCIVAFGGVVFGIVTVRCPFCRRMLDLHGFGTEYCPHCGQKLSDK